nr:hypothetical protein [Endozoicomonas sp.]
MKISDITPASMDTAPERAFENRSQRSEAKKNCLCRFGRWVIENPGKVFLGLLATTVGIGSTITLATCRISATQSSISYQGRGINDANKRSLLSEFPAQTPIGTSDELDTITAQMILDSTSENPSFLQNRKPEEEPEWLKKLFSQDSDEGVSETVVARHSRDLPAPTTPAMATLNPITAPPPPQWSYVVVDVLSVSALIAAAGAPVVQLVKDWKAYLQSGQIPNVRNNSWLIIDFAGRSLILGMLTVQALVQNVELTAFNFLTPASAVIIEVIVIGSVVYFRHRRNQSDYLVDN